MSERPPGEIPGEEGPGDGAEAGAPAREEEGSIGEGAEGRERARIVEPVSLHRLPHATGRAAPLQDAEALFWRTALRSGAVVLLAGFAVLTILAWSAIQITDRDNATRILKRTLVPLTEIDDLLGREYEGLIRAAHTGEASTLEVPGYPLPIAIPTRQLAGMTRGELRASLLEQSAARLYTDGVSAFQREQSTGGGSGIFSAQGVMRRTVGQLTRDSHQITQIVGGLLAFVTALLVVAVIVSTQGFARVQHLGLAIMIGAVPMTVVVVGVRFALRNLAEETGDPFNAELLGIGVQALSIPIRNFIIFAVLGLGILALGILLGLWERRLLEGEWPGPEDEGRQSRSQGF